MKWLRQLIKGSEPNTIAPTGLLPFEVEVVGKSDDEVVELITDRLRRAYPASVKANHDEFVTAIKALPQGLRAMAASHELDVSVTLDDLGWHFANWYHLELANETLRGLRELEAVEVAALFEEAYQVALRFWEPLGQALSNDRFSDWYCDSELRQALELLNNRMWALREELGDLGLMRYWVLYARKYPHRMDASPTRTIQ